jgi:hypothetical protein
MPATIIAMPRVVKRFGVKPLAIDTVVSNTIPPPAQIAYVIGIGSVLDVSDKKYSATM